MPVDRGADRAVYRQIADELRLRIVAGEYQPGSKLPSEAELVDEYGVTRITARRALALLAGEGLTEAQRGRGVFVRDRPVMVICRVDADLYRRAELLAGVAGADTYVADFLRWFVGDTAELPKRGYV